MKIDICEIVKAIEKGLSVEEYVCLKVLEDGCSYLFPNNYFQISMEYCDAKGNLTLKSKQLLKEIEGNVSKKVDSKYEELHKKLQNKLIELIGSKQKTLNKKYSFLCNSQDLASKLSKTIKKYKLNDWDKIEKLLLQHTINSFKANWEYVLLVEYYIEKNNSSKLATDYDNFEDKQEETKNTSSEIIL